jgi:hypothetical protein
LEVLMSGASFTAAGLTALNFSVNPSYPGKVTLDPGLVPLKSEGGEDIFIRKGGSSMFMALNFVGLPAADFDGGFDYASGGGGRAKLSFSDKFVLEKAVDLSVGQGSHAHTDTSWSGQGSRTTTTRWTASANPAWTANQHVGMAFMDSAGYYFYITGNGSNYVDVQSVEGRTMCAGSYTGTIIRTQTETVFQDAVKDWFDAPAAGSSAALCDKNLSSFGAIIVADGYIDTVRSFLATDKGYIVGAKLCASIGQATYNGVGRSMIMGGGILRFLRAGRRLVHADMQDLRHPLPRIGGRCFLERFLRYDHPRHVCLRHRVGSIFRAMG